MNQFSLTKLDSELNVSEPKSQNVNNSFLEEDYFNVSEPRERRNSQPHLDFYSDSKEFQEFIGSTPTIYTNVCTFDMSPLTYDNRRDYFNDFKDNDRFLNDIQGEIFSDSVRNEKISMTNENQKQPRVSGQTIVRPFEVKEDKGISDALNRLFGEPKSAPKQYKTDLAVRKDVVYKNLLRIISRYFKSILTTNFPDFAKCFKIPEKLDSLLSNFYYAVFKQASVDDMKYILGAFVLAPKMRILTVDSATKKKVSMIHKTLSKYTHKDLEQLYEISELQEVVGHFLTHGLQFLNDQEVVDKHSSVYFQALETLRNNFKLQNTTLITSLTTSK